MSNYVYMNVYVLTLKSIIKDFENQIVEYEMVVPKNNNEIIKLAILRKECETAKQIFKLNYPHD